MFTSPKAIHTDFSFKMCGLERKVITISIQIETEIFQFVLKPAKGKEFSTNTLTNKVLPFRRAEEQSSGCPTFIGLVRVAQILRQDWGVPVLHHGVGGELSLWLLILPWRICLQSPIPTAALWCPLGKSQVCLLLNESEQLEDWDHALVFFPLHFIEM